MRETGKPRAGPPGLSVWSLLSWASWELGGEAWGCLGATMPPPNLAQDLAWGRCSNIIC